MSNRAGPLRTKLYDFIEDTTAVAIVLMGRIALFLVQQIYYRAIAAQQFVLAHVARFLLRGLDRDRLEHGDEVFNQSTELSELTLIQASQALRGEVQRMGGQWGESHIPVVEHLFYQFVAAGWAEEKAISYIEELTDGQVVLYEAEAGEE